MVFFKKRDSISKYASIQSYLETPCNSQKGWKRRYFRLEGTSLVSYANHKLDMCKSPLKIEGVKGIQKSLILIVELIFFTKSNFDGLQIIDL